MTSSLHDTLIPLFSEIRLGFGRIIRWQKFVQHLPIRHESLLEHTFDTALLALVASEIVDIAHPELKLDKYKILACALLHDVPEVRTGDIAYAEKRSIHEIEEAWALRSMFQLLPGSVRERLEYSFALQSDTIAGTLDCGGSEETPEARVFEFVERYGYLLFALEQVQEDVKNLPLLAHVLQMQTDRLIFLISALPGLGQILDRGALRELQAVIQHEAPVNVER
ncbi:HD domain-containing protein [Hydrogenophaga sp. H7]|uniref:HD domain-containing protein n=1 Tax=Hydrogenophaga sp. H7 TaxID=1882399 RepID=UPI0009A26DCC|nr:HD domain-containing protein [Hydrogenophaga sp. H7]OPF64319.1 hypothetical protein BC358_05630 [Hydrogenophaga sp. H7]